MDLILPSPAGSWNADQAALVMVPGVHIDSRAYKPLLTAMQRTAHGAGLSLFAGCLHVDWHANALRHPDDLKQRVDCVIAALNSAGMPKDVPCFHAAHSLSTVFLQDYLASHGSSEGQILLGGCLLRKHWSRMFSYPVPTLTIGAELDGEEKYARQVEQVYVQRDLDQSRFPFVMLEGQTHMQFASGMRPTHIREELPPAVKDDVAHQAISEAGIDFMRSRLGMKGSGVALQHLLRRTNANIAPIVGLSSLYSDWSVASGPKGFHLTGVPEDHDSYEPEVSMF